MELLVIDEVSMLRADLLDAMDYMMQTVRKRLVWWCVYIGDLLQLPPVIRDEEWRTLRNYYRKILFSLACSAAKSAAVYRIVYHFPSDGY
jgi:hypothetical protein